MLACETGRARFRQVDWTSVRVDLDGKASSISYHVIVAAHLFNVRSVGWFRVSGEKSRSIYHP